MSFSIGILRKLNGQIRNIIASYTVPALDMYVILYLHEKVNSKQISQKKINNKYFF